MTLSVSDPFSLASLDSFPEGDALGKEGKFRPYRSTARRSQLLPVRFVPLPKPPPLGGGGISQSEMTEGVPLRKMLLPSPLTIAYYPPRKNGGQNFKKYR